MYAALCHVERLVAPLAFGGVPRLPAAARLPHSGMDASSPVWHRDVAQDELPPLVGLFACIAHNLILRQFGLCASLVHIADGVDVILSSNRRI